MSERKVTKIEVEILDIERLGKEAFEWYSENGKTEDDGVIACETSFPIGVVRTHSGVYALCSEGVGSRVPVSEESPLEIEFYKKFEGGISLYPSMKHTMSDKKIVEYLTGEKKNLADFIRVFGARLEDNYSSWRSFFERKVTEELIESESN